MKNLETLSHLKINVNVSELKQAAKQVQKAVAPTSASGTIFSDGVDVADITEEKRKLQKLIKQRQQAIDENLEYSQKVLDDKPDNPFLLRAKELQQQQDIDLATLQSYREQINEARKKQKALENANLSEVKKNVEKNVVQPEIKANEQQEKNISLWERFKQKVKSVGDVIKKLGDREDKEEKKRKASGYVGKLGKAIVRVAIYRAIRAAIKGIVQTISNGLQAFAEFSPKFEQTMTALTSAGRNFKMSFTAAFAPILESLAPALIQIVNSFTQLNNKLAETIAY